MSSVTATSLGINAPTTTTTSTCDKPPTYPVDHQHDNTAVNDDDSFDDQQVAPVVVLDASQRRRSSYSSAAVERQWTRRLSAPLVVQSVLPPPPLGHAGHATNEPYVFSRTHMTTSTAASSTAVPNSLLTPNRGRADEPSRRLSDPGCCRQWNRDAQWPTAGGPVLGSSSGRDRRSANSGGTPHSTVCRDPMFSFPPSPLAVAATSGGDASETPSLTVTPSSPVRCVRRPYAAIDVHLPTRRHSVALGQLLSSKYLEAIAEETSIARGSGLLGFDSAPDGGVTSIESTTFAFRRHSHSATLNG